jgi:hypothetical protein
MYLCATTIAGNGCNAYMNVWKYDNKMYSCLRYITAT